MLVKRGILDGTLAGNFKGGVYENFVATVLQGVHPVGGKVYWWQCRRVGEEDYVAALHGHVPRPCAYVSKGI